MKIIHTADLHLESKMESNLTKEQAMTRRSELLSSFEEMVEYAASNGVEVILISGDMFDKSNIRKAAMRLVIDTVKSHPEITFFYLRGNHDCDAFDAELAEQAPDNIKYFNGDSWTKYEFGDVVIAGREINNENQSTLYADLILDVGKINIVMMHGQESMYEGNDKTHIINIKALQNKYIDYLALGHIHSYKEERLDERGKYCYPGCPEPRGFDECGKKGFMILNIENGSISTEFISRQKREFVEVEAPIDSDMDMNEIYAAVEESIKDISEENLVKLILTGHTDMDYDIDPERIRDRFSDRFFFLKVYDKTSAKIDYESFAYDRTLKGSFVRMVQKADIDEETKAKMIEIGIKSIMGEDII